MARTVTHPALRVGDARACTRRFGYAPRVAGVPVLPPDATPDQWLAARRPMVTASEIAAVLGVSPHESAFSMWWRKQPDWPGTPTNPAMHIGRKLEAVIGELWSENHPEAVLYRPGAALWAHPIETWMGATPDYLSVWPTVDDATAATLPTGRLGVVNGVRVEPVECKSDEGGKGWGEPGTDAVPTHHRIQVLTQCIVLGVPRGRIMRLSGKRTAEYVIDVHKHPDTVADIITRGRSFWTSLTTGMAPDIDEHDATARTLTELYPAFDEGVHVEITPELAKQYHDAKQAVRDAKTLESFATNRIREILGRERGQYAVTPDGTYVARRSHFKRRGYAVPPQEIDMIKEAK